tara:strand:- start:703 stop:2394 length:1692 start_codon:yes stop_codon:yes gene_type:complete
MKLEQELNKTKNRIGLVSGNLKINEYDDANENVSAHINPTNWNIEINLRKGYNPIKDKRQKAYARKKQINDGKKQILEDILHHELGHWELPFDSGYGCPYDIYNHDLILEAVKKALPENKQSQAGYVANAFEDLIVNTRAREFTENFSGQVLFFDEQGVKTENKYSPFYEAFVKLNMHLWGDNVDRALLKRHNTNDNKIDKAVEEATKILEKRNLFNKQNWPSMAKEFTSILEPLLDIEPTEKLSAFSSNGDNDKEESGNGIEQKMGTREGKEEIAYGRYGSNKQLSPNIESHDQLDSLYKRLSKAIPIKVEAMTREQSLAINPLNFRAFDEDKDDIRKVKPTKLFFNEDGLIFGYPKSHITVTEKSKIQRRSFPDFKMVILDNSGSMEQGIKGNQGNTTYIPWGDNSKYHYALLGFYGIEQFLQSQGVSQYIGHGLSLFSSSTRYKESNFTDIKELRKLALSPEFEGTTIDANSLLNALNGRESFVLSISDGEIGNWDESKSKFFELAEQNYFAHIQIGSGNQFTEDLESHKLPVFHVNSGQELSKLMVDTATNTYRRFTRK